MAMVVVDESSLQADSQPKSGVAWSEGQRFTVYTVVETDSLNHSVNNRTVEQLPLAASRPSLGCHAFIAWSHFRCAFWVTVHLY